DYLEALGVTTIWLSPPYANVQRTEGEDGYHGYWPSDFTEANPRFGTLEELRALVDDVHARGMLVILDVVPNHAGRVFTYDLDADGEVDDGEIEPPYADPPYTTPLLFSHAPRMWRRTGEAWERFALGPEHFHRRGFGDLSDQTQKELGDFPTGLRDLDTENPDVVDALVDTHVWWVAETDVDGFRIDAV
ncbi:MAG TPA: alpha-amylase, partial [Myxococcales bacterium]|nr:alpha-amylase [Myxococcales bacterium]